VEVVIEPRGEEMSTKGVGLAFLALAALALISRAAAGASLTRQQVAITDKGGIHGFVLSPRNTGVVEGDSRTASECCRSRGVVMVTDSEKASLKHYLSAMSWPVRASLGRAQWVSTSISGFLLYGDPPFLGQIAGRCRSLRAVEERGRLLRITPVGPLQANHRRMARAYSEMRAACKQARLTALALRGAIERYYETHRATDKATLQRAERAARRLLPLQRKKIQTFFHALRAWRLATLRYAATLEVPAPAWLKALPVGT